MFFLSAHGKQPCILCRVVRRQCSEIVFISTAKKPHVGGFLFGVAPRIYFNRCLPIMQLLFGWNQCLCAKLTLQQDRLRARHRFRRPTFY